MARSTCSITSKTSTMPSTCCATSRPCIFCSTALVREMRMASRALPRQSANPSPKLPETARARTIRPRPSGPGYRKTPCHPERSNWFAKRSSYAVEGTPTLPAVPVLPQGILTMHPTPEQWVPRPCVVCKGGQRCCRCHLVCHATRVASDLPRPPLALYHRLVAREEAEVYASQSGEAGLGEGAGTMALEQLSFLPLWTKRA